MSSDNSISSNNKKLFSASNISTGVLILLLLLVIVSPDARSLMIRGLMRIGLFQPDIPDMEKSGPSFTRIKPSTTATFLTKGGPVNLQDLRGKVVLLNFWATWCPPCRAEMPSLDQLRRKFQTDTSIVFLAVDVDGNMKVSRAFMDKYEYSLPVATPLGSIPQELFGGTLPTTVILDKDGNITMRHEGTANYNTIEMQEFLQKLK